MAALIRAASAEVGRHTAFAMLVGTYRAGQQNHPDIFWQVVRTDMQLDSEKSAMAFLARLAAAADELDKAQQFVAFLDEYKEGAQHIKFYHDQVYTPETDVVGRVDASCAELRRVKR